MTDRPILFSGAMVRAILAGTKTQTRRLVTTREPLAFLGAGGSTGDDWRDPGEWGWFGEGRDFSGYMVLARGVSERLPNGQDRESIPCPYGEPGDRLWVRETWRVEDEAEADIAYRANDLARRFYSEGDAAWWKKWGAHSRRADGSAKWCPSIYMPRWASRITLKVTEVRVERLQDISEADAVAEGVDAGNGAVARGWARSNYAELWDSINGDRAAWDTNPWVWVVTFSRVTP